LPLNENKDFDFSGICCTLTITFFGFDMTIKEPPIKRSWSKRGLTVFIVMFAVALWVIYPTTQSKLAPGQKQLTDIHDIETLRVQFNHAAGTSRLIILVSPT
jgi:hypothetical protein